MLKTPWDHGLVGDPASAWIETYTGQRFYVLDPRPQDVSIYDIAHALSLICRFTGHVRTFYSVAEHSVRASYACDPKDALWGLLHDASEAYVSDISRPLKHTPEMTPYRTAEKRVMRVIVERFGLAPIEPASVARADVRLLLTEKRDLMPPGPLYRVVDETVLPLDEQILPWSPVRAEINFLNRFDELTGARVMSLFRNQPTEWRNDATGYIG